MSEIEFDVTGVLPFPMRDPHLEGMKATTAAKRKAVELPADQERYRLYTVDELGQFPPVRWLIDRYLAVGELSVLYGQGGTYKSFVALDWAARLARAGHPVVYIVAEGMSGMRARVHAWLKINGVQALPSLYIMPSNVPIHDASHVAAWIAAMKAQVKAEPALVVVDTLARNFVGGSENNPQEMGLFVEGLERMRLSLQSAVLVIHHTTKDGKTERGTESLRNASFAMFKMDKVNSTKAVDVKCDRMKEAEPPADVRLQPQVVPLPDLGVGVDSLVAGWPSSPPTQPGARGKPRGELLAPQRKGLERLLGASQGASEGVSRAVVAKAFGIQPKHVARTIKPLVAAGFLATAGTTSDRRYVVTEQAREALS